MPVYDYMCENCGPFTQMHPMSACDEAQPCPQCKAFSPRAFLTAPNIAAMSSSRRAAHAGNERSAHAPMSVGEYGEKTARAKSHGSGCGCCATGMKSRARTSPSGAKSFPAARPWMISH